MPTNDGKKNFLGNAILEGGIEGLIVSLLNPIVKTVHEHAGEYLKSKIFGIGTNDEALFLSACVCAVEDEGVSTDELTRVINCIGSYTQFQSERIVGIVGKAEEDATTEKNGVKTSYKANVKGGKILALFSKLDDEGIKLYLDNSNASNSIEQKVVNTVKETLSKIKNGELAQDSTGFFKKKTLLERFAESRKTI